MARIVGTITTIMMILVGASAANAGIYADDLSKCLVKSSSTEDVSVLMKWMISSLTLNSTVSKLSNLTNVQRDQFDHDMAKLVDRLVLTDCHSEAVIAIKYEGLGVFEKSFGVLGEIAVRGMMNDPKVAASINRYASYLDKEKYKSLSTEAGLPTASGTTESAK